MNKLFSLQWPRGVLVSIFILGMSRPLGLLNTVGSWVQSEISRYTLKQNKKYPLTQSKKYLDILWSRAMIYLTSLVSWIETWVGERSSITLRCTISHWNKCTAKCTYYLQIYQWFCRSLAHEIMDRSMFLHHRHIYQWQFTNMMISIFISPPAHLTKKIDMFFYLFLKRQFFFKNAVREQIGLPGAHIWSKSL